MPLRHEDFSKTNPASAGLTKGVTMFLFRRFFLMFPDPAPGGGGPSPAPAPAAGSLEALQQQNSELLKRLDALEKKGNPAPAPAPADDPDLATKAAKDRADRDKRNLDSKRMEKAVKLTMGAVQWVKDNASLLPKNMQSILDAAGKENYDSEVDKADAIRVGFLSEFFGQQVNLDLLTDTQKTELAEFMKLTKDKKQERAQSIYEQIFEPTFEMIKKIKKAEQVGAGKHSPSNAQEAYAQKLQDGSRKHYLGETK